MVVIQSCCAAAVEVLRPTGALAGLQAEFGFYCHELARINELLEEFWDLRIELRAVFLQIADEQVHQCFSVGPHTIVYARRAGKFTNQEDEGAQAGAKIAVLAAVTLLADNLVILGFEFSGVEQIGGDLVVDKVCGDDGAHGFRGCLPRGFEDNLQLRAQLSFGAGMVGVTQHLLPEPATGREQRIIGDQEFVVVVSGREASILKMAGKFSLTGFQTLQDRRFLLRLFAEDRLANDALHIGIRKLH